MNKKRNVNVSGEEQKQNERDKLLFSLKEQANLRKNVDKELGSKQLVEEGQFTKSMLTSKKLLKPPYDPVKLLKIEESSGILPQCIDAMVRNIDGFGYDLMYMGTEELEKSEAVAREKTMLNNFYDRVNEKESFTTVRQQVRRDLEITGNGYIEVTRFVNNRVAMLYRVDSKYIRLQALQPDPQEVTINIVRDGRPQAVKIMKRFRKFAMITSTAKNKIRWFKEYGDPRQMDAVTGSYDTVTVEANEMLHFKTGDDTYGIPRWVGVVLTVMGLSSADYVNWDLFENQVVPPLAIMVSGGQLTQESIRDIKEILVQKRGVENFNKILIIEAQSDGSISDKSSAKVEMKEMSFARKEDAMFVQYAEKGEHRCRGAFRLPPLYLGRADSYSKSTADSSKMVAEEQVFVPERNAFDEIMNIFNVTEFGIQYWKYKSKGPRLVTGAELIEGFKVFASRGVITINEGIRLANHLLGMDIVKYDKPWADFPIPIVIELAKLGLLSGIEEIITGAGDFADLVNAADTENKDDQAKIYVALTNLKSTLRRLADDRDRIIGEEDEKVWTPEQIENQEVA